MSDSDDNSYTSYKSEENISHIIGHDGDVSNDNEELVFDPYNPENTEITLNEIQSILLRYGIKTPLNNFNLYRRAFIHRSYTDGY